MVVAGLAGCMIWFASSSDISPLQASTESAGSPVALAFGVAVAVAFGVRPVLEDVPPVEAPLALVLHAANVKQSAIIVSVSLRNVRGVFFILLSPGVERRIA